MHIAYIILYKPRRSCKRGLNLNLNLETNFEKKFFEVYDTDIPDREVQQVTFCYEHRSQSQD